jgi:GntR family transcriptional regulator/MocR family aminotransferase
MVRIKEPRFPVFVCTKNMNADLQIQLDRTAKLSLAEQIRMSISRAIESGLLAPGTRLPSWQDLAAQLGVARGTVQAAYERLSDAQMIETFRAGGTRVAPRPRVAFCTRAFVQSTEDRMSIVTALSRSQRGVRTAKRDRGLSRHR